MKNKVLKLSFLLIAIFSSCSESVLNKNNPNYDTVSTYYQTEDQLTKAVNNIYAAMRSSNLASRFWWFQHDLRSDDVASGGGQLGVAFNQILVGTLSSSNGVVTGTWTGYYQTIKNANTVIQYAPLATSVSTSMINRLLGEAQFLRAFSYFELVSQWGAVPIYKQVVSSVTESYPRSSTADVYALIISDLNAAIANLPASYSGNDVGRATSGAANTLLGKVYMQQGDYASALTALKKVENTYSLMPDYVDNFKEETGFNAESIFEIGFSGTNFNWNSDGSDSGSSYANAITQELSSVGWRNLIPSDALLGDFERTSKGDAKNDPRFATCFVKAGDLIVNDSKALDTSKVQGNLSSFEGHSEKISWRKYTSIYKNDNGYYTGSMNMRILRYADVLLMIAECLNETGGANAISYLNQVRARKSVSMAAYPTSNYPCNSKDEIFRAVVHERRIELAGEQQRARDILRWRANGKIGVGKIVADPMASLPSADKNKFLPIPATEISTNPKITEADQNTGY